jgi:hypothetical protein
VHSAMVVSSLASLFVLWAVALLVVILAPEPALYMNILFAPFHRGEPDNDV